MFRKCWDREDREVIIIIGSWFLRSRIYFNQGKGDNKKKNPKIKEKQTITTKNPKKIGVWLGR